MISIIYKLFHTKLNLLPQKCYYKSLVIKPYPLVENKLQNKSHYRTFIDQII